MSWYGNWHRPSKGNYEHRIGRGDGSISRRAASGFAGRALCGLGLVAAIAGCSISPAVTKNGLPKVTRYASPAQLDWMLSRYEAISQAAAAPGVATELHDEACLGWERAVFDLQSARRYPMRLRMSAETTILENLWENLPLLIRRHPLPSSCAAGADRAPGQLAGAPAPAAQVLAPPASSPEAAVTAPPQRVVAAGPDGSVAPESPVVVAPPLASAAPPVPPPPPLAESSTAKQRRLLARLRTALGFSLDPGAGGGAGAVKDPAALGAGQPEVLYEIDRAAVEVLTELAQSDLPPIRLRARYHLLGLCTLAVEESDRYFVESPENQPDQGARVAGALPAGGSAQRVCGRVRSGESLRAGQSRLLWSLLGAWRVRYVEPMSDLVNALASFASRDNPVVDGPRVSR